MKIPLTPKQKDLITTIDSLVASFPWKKKAMPMDVVMEMRNRLERIYVTGEYEEEDRKWLNTLRQEYINQKFGKNNV